MSKNSFRCILEYLAFFLLIISSVIKKKVAPEFRITDISPKNLCREKNHCTTRELIRTYFHFIMKIRYQHFKSNLFSDGQYILNWNMSTSLKYFNWLVSPSVSHWYQNIQREHN